MRSNDVSKLWIFLRYAAVVVLVSLLVANWFDRPLSGGSYVDSTAFAQKADSKKTGSTKKETNKPDTKKADVSSSETPKSGSKKGSSKKPETSKAGNKKGDTKKPETPKSGSKKGSSKKPETSKASNKKGDTKKPETPKSGSKKGSSKKPETPKADNKKGSSKKPETPKADPSKPVDAPTGAARVNSGRLAALTIFVLAVFVGFEVITKVPPTLHTPLMSGSNAISGITIVGAMIVAGHQFWHSHWLGMIAIALATVNVVGGFLVTHRMLAMFRKR